MGKRLEGDVLQRHTEMKINIVIVGILIGLAFGLGVVSSRTNYPPKIETTCKCVCECREPLFKEGGMVLIPSQDARPSEIFPDGNNAIRDNMMKGTTVYP